MGKLFFLNEDGVVLYNQSDTYISHLPAVGVDSTSTGTIFAVSDQDTIDVEFIGYQSSYYRIVEFDGKQWNDNISDYPYTISYKKKINIEDEELKLFAIRVACAIPDAEDTMSTTSALTTIKATCSGASASMAIITEFVEANTNELLAKTLISNKLDKYIVNACDCHSADSENPDLMMYNRKLKELLMTKTLSSSTYNELYNILHLFGFDRMKVYDVFKKDEERILMDNSALHNNKISSSIIENYIRCYEIVVALQLYKYGVLKGEHLTDSVTPEFESDLNYYDIYPDFEDEDAYQGPVVQITDAQIHPNLGAFEPIENSVLTLTGQNQLEYYSTDKAKGASITPTTLNDGDRNHFPEVVPYINSLDGTDTVTRYEMQQKASLIKRIIKDSFSIIYNNIISCSIEDAAYSNNIKVTSHASATHPNVYDDLTDIDDDDEYSSNILVSINGQDMTLDEWLESNPHVSIHEADLDVIMKGNTSDKIMYFVDKDGRYTYPSNCRPTAEITTTYSYTPPIYEYWHYHSICAEMPTLSFTGISKGSKWEDFRFIEIFAVKSNYKKGSSIEENIYLLKKEGNENMFTRSLHDCVGEVPDFILLPSVGTWSVTINIYNNYKENPLYTKTFEMQVDNGVSMPQMYSLKHATRVSDLDTTKSIMNIHHNESFMTPLDSTIDHYYSRVIDESNLHKTKTYKFGYDGITFTCSTISKKRIKIGYNSHLVYLECCYTSDAWPMIQFELSDYYDADDPTNLYIYRLSQDINTKIIEKYPDATVLVNIHKDEVDTTGLYVTFVDVCPNTNVRTYYNNPPFKEDTIFWPAVWFKIGKDKLTRINDSNSVIYNRNIKDDMLYIIENSNGYYTDTDDTYTIVSDTEVINKIPTSAIVVSKGMLSEANYIACSYYKSFIQHSIYIR